MSYSYFEGNAHSLHITFGWFSISVVLNIRVKHFPLAIGAVISIDILQCIQLAPKPVVPAGEMLPFINTSHESGQIV